MKTSSTATASSWLRRNSDERLAHDDPGHPANVSEEAALNLSVVFPVYNEAGNVEALVDDVVRACDPLGIEYEIVVVDDGRRDGTTDVLRRVKQRVPRLRVIFFRRNFGQTAALQACIAHARGDILITMDGDGENDPADIPRMLESLNTGVDMVCGWRQGRWQGSFLSRRLPSEAANWLIAYATNRRLHASAGRLQQL